MAENEPASILVMVRFHLPGAPVTPQTVFRAALLVEFFCILLFKKLLKSKTFRHSIID